MTTRWMLAAAIAAMATAPVMAQSTFPTRASGVKVGGSVAMVCDANEANCRPAGPTAPMPVMQAPLAPASSTPLTGTSTGAQTVGPFTPVPGRVITIALSASSWPGGNVQLLRSINNGTTKLPLTPAGVPVAVYSGVGADSPWVETETGATYYLSLPGAGITYRVAQ